MRKTIADIVANIPTSARIYLLKTQSKSTILATLWTLEQKLKAGFDCDSCHASWQVIELGFHTGKELAIVGNSRPTQTSRGLTFNQCPVMKGLTYLQDKTTRNDEILFWSIATVKTCPRLAATLPIARQFCVKGAL